MGSICANCCRRASQAPTALAKIPAVNTYQLPGNTSAVATEITAASIATTKLTRSRNIGTVKAIKVNGKIKSSPNADGLGINAPNKLPMMVLVAHTK